MRFRALLLCAAVAPTLSAAGPIVVLIGPPASGKSTQAEILKKEMGMSIIRAEDLIARNQQEFERYKHPTIQGVEPRLDPAMNGLVEEALRHADLQKGVILDGYPAAKIQADHLASLQEKFELPKPIVIHLVVPDNVARKRASKDRAATIEQELKDYHREMDFARTYFPQANIHDIDGTKKPDEVAKEIRRLLEK